MSLFVYFDGGDRSYTMRLVEGFHTAAAAETGTVSICTLQVDDPTGVLNLVGLKRAYIVETAASPTRVWTGYLFGKRISRGPYNYRLGAARVWDCEAVDLNFDLNRRVIRSSDAKRPAETDLARLTWLLAHASLAGLVYTGSLTNLTDNPINLGEADYRGQFPINVLADMTPVAGKTAFVIWDSSNNRPQLFYDQTTVTTNDSSIAISNVLADVDNSTTFAPDLDAELERTPEDTYSGIYLEYKNGVVYQTNSTTASTYGERDFSVGTSRIGALATAQAYATKFLTVHAIEDDTVTVTVELPAAKVNSVIEGQRISVKFSHLPDLSTPTSLRVIRRNVSQRTDQNYLVTLTLSKRIKVALPSPVPPSDFPHQTGPLAIIQQSVGLSTRTLASTPTDGDVLVIVISQRSGDPSGFIGSPLFYTDSGEGGVSQGAADYVRGGYKTASSSSASFSGNLDLAIGYYELSAGATLVDHASAHGSGYAVSGMAAVSVPAGGIAFGIAGIGSGGGFDAGAGYSNAWTPSSGFTEDFDSKVSSGHPATEISYYVNSTSAAVSVTFAPTFLNDGQGPWPWQALVMVFGPDAASSPPAPGQWTQWTEVTMSTVGGVSTGTTAFPYADGSLEVKVQSQPILPANYTETDGATGDFALSWEIDADEHVYVRYQGR